MKVMYIDCSAGLSGGALLGALAELVANPEILIETVKSCIKVPFQMHFNKIRQTGSSATAAIIKTGTGTKRIPVVAAAGSLTCALTMADKVRDALNAFFDRYIQALARVAGITTTEVRLPENEIYRMAIIGVAYYAALDFLGVDQVTSSPVPVVSNEHGQDQDRLILELARGMAVTGYEGRSTPVTPLGLALLASRLEGCGPLPEMLLAGVGYGTAGENPVGAGVRALYGTFEKSINETACPDNITVVETAIDDINPEFFPFLVERLMSGGALDAFLTPIYMKKGRPAHLLTALCRQAALEDVLGIIFSESTTLGVRIREERRRVLPRCVFKVRTSYGEVSVKAGYLTEGGPPVQLAPEFEDCKKLALQHQVPVKEVYGAAQQAARLHIYKHANGLP